ncbi:uncharacterized protein LOC133873182 [Alnus glutinosa]|uniref:uncharacterized protein LOC133873182 n=1 Tax=Alnus glutinosa TaxID=3517 RepID=UPI002D77A32F|nr:uncharacterized protein LOC133873182 [Alnus glutinosa]
MADLALKPPKDLYTFMVKVDRYINQKETLRALLGDSQQQQQPSTEKPKKKKKPEATQDDSPREYKKIKRNFRDYKWTPLNASLTEVLMELKKDPHYQRPTPIPRNPPLRLAHKYCAFHDSYGHLTEQCVSLRENRKLVRFLVDERNQQRQERDQYPGPRREEDRNERRNYQPRQEERKDEDYAGVSLPHTDALVVSLTIANHQTRRILVDTGSFADVLFKSAFDYMGVPLEKVIPVTCHLLCFVGEEMVPLGSIELHVTAGTYPRQKVIMVKFLIVEKALAYNAIIGRTALNDLKAVTSTHHLSMKFPTEEGVGVVKGGQREARRCYNLSLKNTPKKCSLGKKTKEEEKYQSPLREPVEELEEFEVGDPKKRVRIGSQLPQHVKEELVAFLRCNSDVFAWSHEDMSGIDPSVIVHKLNVEPNHRPMK